MVKHNVSTLQAMFDAKLTGPIDKIDGRPTFRTLWHLQRQLIEGPGKVGNFKLPLEGHVGYILSKEAFTLFSSKEWRDPEEVGEYYEISVTLITYMEQRTKENKRKVKK